MMHPVATSMVFAQLCLAHATAPGRPWPMRGGMSLEVTSNGDVVDAKTGVKARSFSENNYEYYGGGQLGASSSNGYYEYYGGAELGAEEAAEGEEYGITSPTNQQATGKSKHDVNTVICPFFATMMNAGHLPKQDSYTREELTKFSMEAGISAEIAAMHVGSNFRNVRTNVTDLFNMEGFPNEHFTSTGINDCESKFPEEGLGECAFEKLIGDYACPTPKPVCNTPVVRARKYIEFWDALDTNKDMKVDQAELTAVEELYDPKCSGEKCIKSVDINYGAQLLRPVSGDIQGSYGLLIQVFGDCKTLTKDELFNITVKNMPPAGFVFPAKKQPKCPPAMAEFDRTCLNTLLGQIKPSSKSNKFAKQTFKQVEESIELLINHVG